MATTLNWRWVVDLMARKNKERHTDEKKKGSIHVEVGADTDVGEREAESTKKLA